MREHMWLSTLGLVMSLPRKYHDTQNKQLEEGKREGAEGREKEQERERGREGEGRREREGKRKRKG